jgi:lipopolysaccharide transport system ATP-binding protein
MRLSTLRGVEQFIDTPVKFYSSGMYLRLAFAVAAHLEPEILVVDEVLAVGDTAFQKKCIGRMEAVAQEGRTVLFVSHNMGAVRSLCNKAVYLHQGQSEGISEVGECIGRYFEAVGAMPGKQSGQDSDIPTAGFGRVMVFDGTGNTVLNSEECEISATFKFDPGYSGFTIFGILEDMHGKMVFQLRRENFEIGAKDCPPGIYRIKLRLPALWLNPGLYAFHFKAILSGDGITKQVSDKFPLDVDGAHSTKVDCVLNPMDKWEVIPEST